MKHIWRRAVLLVPAMAVSACNTAADGGSGSRAADAGRQIQRGAASWYGPGFQGRRTASGETFRADDMTAAHRFLPFGTRVRVVHEVTGRSVVVRINDRGPFHGSRIIDLAQAPARSLGLVGEGSTVVSLHSLD